MNSDLNSRAQPYLLVLAACFILGVFQTAHFHVYFEQPLWLSTKWSVKGSAIWLGIFLTIMSTPLVSRMSKVTAHTELLTWVALAFFCGALQIFITVFMSFLLGTAGRPLLDDFLHLYSKRFIQNLLIAGLFLSWWRFATKVDTNKSSDENTTRENTPKQAQSLNRRIKISDGSKILWLEKSEITHAEALGNYVCVYTAEKQHIARSTLSALTEELSNDGFIRISRSTLVKRANIKSYHRINKNKFELKTTSDHTLTVGRTYLKEVKQVLEI